MHLGVTILCYSFVSCTGSPISVQVKFKLMITYCIKAVWLKAGYLFSNAHHVCLLNTMTITLVFLFHLNMPFLTHAIVHPSVCFAWLIFYFTSMHLKHLCSESNMGRNSKDMSKQLDDVYAYMHIYAHWQTPDIVNNSSLHTLLRTQLWLSS